MTWLRVASLTVLALWIGGLAVLGFVAAPAIFAALEARDPSGGRVLAGAVFGAVLARFQFWMWGLGVTLLVLYAVRSLLGPRPLRLAVRVSVVVLMLSLGAVSAYYISPRIDQIRNETNGSIASLSDGDPRKSEFGRLHGLSSILMLCTLGAGISLVWAELHDH